MYLGPLCVIWLDPLGTRLASRCAGCAAQITYDYATAEAVIAPD